jgi:tubulin-specific chaperone B
LELVTGIPTSNQIIKLYRTEDDAQPIAVLDDEERPLGYYSVLSGQILKVHAIDYDGVY